MSKTRKLRKARVREQKLLEDISIYEDRLGDCSYQLDVSESRLSSQLERMKMVDRLLVEIFGENSIFFPPNAVVVSKSDLRYGFSWASRKACSAIDRFDPENRNFFSDEMHRMEVFLLKLRDSGLLKDMKMKHFIVSDSSGHEYGYAVSKTELLGIYGMSVLSGVSGSLADYIKKEAIRQLANDEVKLSDR